MEATYVVASAQYWASIPKTRELPCARVRYTGRRMDPARAAGVYSSKSEAQAHALRDQLALIRETQYDQRTWVYQLLLQGQV